MSSQKHIIGKTPFDQKKSLGTNMHLFLKTWLGEYPDSAWKDLDTLIHGANLEDMSFSSQPNPHE